MSASVATWTRKDLLGIAELSAAEIELILDTAESFREVAERPIKKVPTLRGKTVINLFFEASTRTRSSFEIAEKRLSADNLNFATAGSALEKGETLIDTALNLQAMAPDLIVIRHAHPGAPHLLAKRLKAAGHQRRRRRARASHPGAARRLHHPPAQGADRRPARSPSSATSSTAAWCARTSTCSRKLGAEVTVAGPLHA